MPEITDRYHLDYFKQGSYYSAKSDLRRFLTLDYNLKSYIGIVGVGVIEGWTIDPLGGLKVQILPGAGIINGYYSESPYTVKQRSDMVDGDREVSIVPSPDGEPEPNLTPSQRATYVAVIQLYDPSYNPVGPIENAFVKVVVPTELTLSNNSDNFIYAERPSEATPYPILNDYPSPAGAPPNRNDYADYDDYEAALDVYNAKLEAIHDYQWYSNANNHFTAVNFVIQSSKRASTGRVLIGKVITRDAEIRKIDTSGVDNLANLQSEIRRIATELLVDHRHGGGSTYDPPKIRLETDIRDAVLYSYDVNTGRATYSVTAKVTTSIELGHKHTYEIDEDGNGQTMDQIGSTNRHFHKIEEWVVGSPEVSSSFVEDHIHTVEPPSEDGDTWDSNSRYVVYVNDEKFGDETTGNVRVNSSTKRITFEKGINASYNKYSTSFPYNYVLSNGQTEYTTFTYSARAVSVL